MRYIIGIDIGTTHAKAVVAGRTGKVMAEFKKTYPTLQPSPGCYEQDPKEIFTAFLDILQKAIHSVPADEIMCASFSAAMHSMMALDTNSEPLTNLWIWSDTRSQSLAVEWKDTENGKALHQRTGTAIHPMSPLFKIAWLRHKMPELHAKASKFISGKEYIVNRLFDEWVIDYSLASATGMFDIRQKTWDKEALSIAGISLNQLSMPVQPTHILKGLKKEWKDHLKLKNEFPFVIGASDGALANIGGGAILPNEAALTIGTSGAIRKIGSSPVDDPQQRLFNYRIDDDCYLTGGATNNGGIILKWFVDTFTDCTKSFETYINELAPLAAAVPPGSDGLVFLPYLYGERAPVWDASAKGVFMGIHARHTKAHFLRAIFEGIAFSLLQILDAMEENGEKIDTVYASGGFIESTLWLRIVTDILQKKIKLSRVADASAMGAIFMGMRAMGLLNEWNDTRKFIQEDEELRPDASTKAAYAKNYEVFRRLYPGLVMNYEL